MNNMKMIYNRVISNSQKMYLLRNRSIVTNPLKFDKIENNLNTSIMYHYNIQRRNNYLKNYLTIQKDVTGNKRYLEMNIKNTDNELSLMNSELEKYIHNNFLNNTSLNIEIVCNTLFLMAENNFKNEKLENTFLQILESKELENSSFSNILDLVYFLKKTNNPKWKENEKKIYDLLEKKIMQLKDMKLVRLNGNSNQTYEEIKESNKNNFLHFYKQIDNEKNFVEFLNDDLLNEEEMYLEGKDSFLIFNLKKIMNNLNNLRMRRYYQNKVFDISYLDEFRRLTLILNLNDDKDLQKCRSLFVSK